MRKIIACEFTALDGVIQSDPAEGFEYGAVIQERLGKEVDLLLGRKTFDVWEPDWPTHSHLLLNGNFGREARD